MSKFVKMVVELTLLALFVSLALDALGLYPADWPDFKARVLAELAVLGMAVVHGIVDAVLSFLDMLRRFFDKFLR